MLVKPITRSISQTISRSVVGDSGGDNPDAELKALIQSLYSGGEVGGFYIPQPMVLGQQSLFQDSAGTIPVTADGDPVGLMVDLSGNGLDLKQSASSKRPTYRTDGARHWLYRDGVDDFLRSDNLPSAPARPSLVYAGSDETNSKAILILPYAADSWGFPYFSFGVYSNGQVRNDGQSFSFSPRPYQGGDMVVSVNSGDNAIRVNGAYSASIDGEDNTYDGSIPIILGATSLGDEASEGEIYACMVVGGWISSEDRSAVEQLFAELSGVALP